MGEWVNEWMNEWMNDWMNESMDEWIKKKGKPFPVVVAMRARLENK